MKKIIAEQFEQINNFVRKHYVEYYDLQCELADHLANGIEAQWEENPNLSFEDALQKEFKKFGVFGFTQVVEQRQLALSKKYGKIMWQYAKDFLKLPKIFLSIGLVVFIYTLLSIDALIYNALLLVILVFTSYKFIARYQRYRKKAKLTGKRWLFEDLIYRGGGMGVITVLPFQLSVFTFEDGVMPIYINCLLALWMVGLLLFYYIMLYVIPSKAKQLLEETYPEYKMEISA